jgi:hypothetical protein
MFNPNSSATTGTLILRTEDGQTAGNTSVQLAPLASTSIVLSSTFNNPATGYVLGTFSSPVVSYESFGNGNVMNNITPTQQAGNNGVLFAPFFASGSGFQSDLNLVNFSSALVTLKTQFFDGSGMPAGPAFLITIPAGDQLNQSILDFFPAAPSTGYIRFDVPPSLVTPPFGPTYPEISGHVRVRSAQGGSTIVPMTAFPLQDAFVLGAATAPGEFQGISLVNTGSSAATVSLQAINSSGTVAGTATVTLNPGQNVSKLATELFGTGFSGQSVIHISAPAPIAAAAITGSGGLDTLRSLPVLR